MDNKYWSFFFMTQWLATIYVCLMDNQLVPYVRVDTFSYFPNSFLISKMYSHNLQVYIIIDMLLYSYTLLIDHISYFS